MRQTQQGGVGLENNRNRLLPIVADADSGSKGALEQVASKNSDPFPDVGQERQPHVCRSTLPRVFDVSLRPVGHLGAVK